MFQSRPSTQSQNEMKASRASKERFFESRYQSFADLFARFDITMTDFLSEDDFLRLLDTLSEGQFDRELSDGLFAKIPKQLHPENETVRLLEVQDFVYTFIKAEYLLLTKAEQVEQNLREVDEQLATLYHHTDVLRQNSSPDGREALTLEVIEVVSDDIQREDAPNALYTAVVRYQNYKYETEEVANASREFNPRFEHTFHIKISSLKDKFTLCLRRYDDPAKPLLYKESTANFTFDLADQTCNQAWVELYDQSRKYTKEKMHISVTLQMQNSLQVKDCLEKMDRLQEYQHSLYEEKDLIQKSIADLVSPFAFRRIAGGQVRPHQGPADESEVNDTSDGLPVVNKITPTHVGVRMKY